MSQPLALDAIAVAGSGGTATFIFDPVPSQTTYTGTLSCSAAPATSTWTAVVGSSTGARAGVGTPWGAWGGQSVFGPIQARSGQMLAVTATGLSPGSSYILAWRGLAEDATADNVYPAANTSAQTAQIAGAGLAGQSSSLKTQVLVGATHGASTNFNSVAVGTYRLFGWGWFPTSFIAADPTKGVIQIEFGAGGAGGAWDQLSYVEAASDRLDGLTFAITNTIGIIVSNYFDVDVNLFVNLSTAI